MRYKYLLLCAICLATFISFFFRHLQKDISKNLCTYKYVYTTSRQVTAFVTSVYNCPPNSDIKRVLKLHIRFFK